MIARRRFVEHADIVSQKHETADDRFRAATGPLFGSCIRTRRRAARRAATSQECQAPLHRGCRTVDQQASYSAQRQESEYRRTPRGGGRGGRAPPWVLRRPADGDLSLSPAVGKQGNTSTKSAMSDVPIV